MYGKLSGMTGTALTEEEEFREIYGLDVVEIPTNKPMIRKDLPDTIFLSEKSKLNAIIAQIKECHEKGQPVLVGTVSIEKSELLSALLKKTGIPHTVLNAKYHEREAEIVAQAGKFGAVTISTNMAGRGTDIMLGGNPEFLAKNEMRKNGRTEEEIYDATSYFATADENILALRREYSENLARFEAEVAPEAKKVAEAGGLFILGTERHESRRIDNQLRGRAGRQGDPGASRFMISIDDDLMRLFGNERAIEMMRSLGAKAGEEIVLDMKLMSDTIEGAQKRLEGQNFERRKAVLMYDDVMNQQREKIYGQRRDVLEGKDIKPTVIKMIEEYVSSVVGKYLQDDVPDNWNFDSLRSEFLGLLTTEEDFRYTQKDFDRITQYDVEDELIGRARKLYDEKEEKFGAELLREAERTTLLRSVDEGWVEHITAMDDLRGSIGLRAYAQVSPIVAYRREGSDMFAEMVDNIRENTAKRMLAFNPEAELTRLDFSKIIIDGAAAARTPQRSVYGNLATPQKSSPSAPVRVTKVGRNDPCPCGSGKKYKKCCGLSDADAE
jgi:preprotein translocase subunit SecA